MALAMLCIIACQQVISIAWRQGFSCDKAINNGFEFIDILILTRNAAKIAFEAIGGNNRQQIYTPMSSLSCLKEPYFLSVSGFSLSAMASSVS